ncbi:MAG: ComEC/Rec2 family competence protein [Gammaproteobacteria bacterium]|nr:ComEC/Rec2 family competence protein [Gammaproteobacteria bacterium]
MLLTAYAGLVLAQNTQRGDSDCGFCYSLFVVEKPLGATAYGYQIEVIDRSVGFDGLPIKLLLYSEAELSRGYYTGNIVYFSRLDDDATNSWLRAEGVNGKGRLVGRPTRLGPRHLESTPSSLINNLDGLRHRGLIWALVTGNKQYVDDDHKRTLRLAGIAHLLAVSGLHIGLWTLLVYRLTLFLPARRQSNSTLNLLLVALCLVGYLYAIHWPVSAVRAALAAIAMLTLWQLGLSQRRWYLALPAVMLSLVPRLSLSVGFWMSYLTWLFMVLAAVLIGTSRKGVVLISATASAVSLPMSLHWFGYFGVFSLFNNLWAVPLVSLLIYPLSLLAVIGVPWAGEGANALIDVLLKVLSDWASILQTPFSRSISGMQMLFALSLLLALLLPIDRHQKLLCVFFLTFFAVDVYLA